MTKNELRQARARRYYAKKVRSAIVYLYGTRIDKKPLMMAVGILRVLSVGIERGWLYPEDIVKLMTLVRTKSLRKHAGAK